MTMNVNLTPQLEQMVRAKVESGRYSSASEVVREALRLMEERDRLYEAKLGELRAEIRKGVESGPAAPFDADAIKRKARTRQRPAKPVA